MSDEHDKKRNTASPSEPPDMLCGASEIAEFLFGNPKARRRVYHFYEQHGMPGFKVGNGLYARRSTLLKWIEDKEN